MPTYSTTTKYALRTLQGSNLASDIDQGFADLGSDIDANMAGYAQGTLASLPAAGKSGRLYRATDTRAILMDTGSAWVDLVPQRVTSLPGTPYDGQVIHYVADATNGVIWPLRYNASGGTYKWEVCGGGALSAEVLTNESTTSTSYTDLATVGPSLTLPLAGDYDISFGAEILVSASTSDIGAGVGVKVGSSAVASSDTANFLIEGISSATGHSGISCPHRKIRRTVTPASTVVKLQFSTTNASFAAFFQRRSLSITPVRVG